MKLLFDQNLSLALNSAKTSLIFSQDRATYARSA